MKVFSLHALRYGFTPEHVRSRSAYGFDTTETDKLHCVAPVLIKKEGNILSSSRFR